MSMAYYGLKNDFLLAMGLRYDLTRLLIGSEGTLGIITEITLRLQKIPEASVVSWRHFLNFLRILLLKIWAKWWDEELEGAPTVCTFWNQISFCLKLMAGTWMHYVIFVLSYRRISFWSVSYGMLLLASKNNSDFHWLPSAKNSCDALKTLVG